MGVEWKPQPVRHVSHSASDHVVFAAVRWFENGDHPGDMCRVVADTNTGEHFLSEGHIVRHFPHSSHEGSELCADCGSPFDRHGWIDIPNGPSPMVCPGDWVLLSQNSRFHVIDDTHFHADCSELPSPATDDEQAISKDWCVDAAKREDGMDVQAGWLSSDQPPTHQPGTWAWACEVGLSKNSPILLFGNASSGRYMFDAGELLRLRFSGGVRCRITLEMLRATDWRVVE